MEARCRPTRGSYEDDGLTPNKRGLSIIAYVQWLGSWQPRLEETVWDVDGIEQAYPMPKVVHAAPEAAPESDEPASDEDFWDE